MNINSFYLAGPINACSDEEIHNWRDRVLNVANEFNQNRKDPITLNIPQPFDYDAKIPSFIVNDDKNLIRKSDALLVFPWKVSVGTSMEIMYANSIGIPVYAISDSRWKLSPWIRYHANIYHERIDEFYENENAPSRFNENFELIIKRIFVMCAVCNK